MAPNETGEAEIAHKLKLFEWQEQCTRVDGVSVQRMSNAERAEFLNYACEDDEFHGNARILVVRGEEGDIDTIITSAFCVEFLIPKLRREFDGTEIEHLTVAAYCQTRLGMMPGRVNREGKELKAAAAGMMSEAELREAGVEVAEARAATMERIREQAS